MSKMSRVEELSPDGYARFYILIDILKQIYGNSQKEINILDVGGGSEYMEQQLVREGIRYKLTVLDIIERPKKLKATFIQGDATNMPFPDKSFDAVISTDVLEHVLPAGKSAFVDECLRVSKEICVIAAPFETEAVTDAEIAVNEFNKQLFGAGQEWLEEHLEQGKPKVEMMHKVLKNKKVTYVDFGTQNIFTWLLNTHLNLIEAKSGLNHKKHVTINKFYNQNILSMNEFDAPSYRHFFVMFIDGALRSKLNEKRYTNAKKDMSKVVRYTSDLLGLAYARIAELKKYEAKAAQLAYKNELHQHKQAELEKTIKDQQNILDKFSLVIKIAKSVPIQKIKQVNKK